MTTLRSGCKINLFLDITALRTDGKHELYTLFWPLAEPHDELRLRPGPAGSGFSLRCSAPYVDPTRNTLYAAWHAYAEASGFRPDLEVELHKGVPAGAGLGGGSADAAALLQWLNTQAPQPVPETQLARMAVSVGADVPFFLHNRPTLATGIGEIFSDFPRTELYTGLWLVLVCPEIAVSTAWAFRAYDQDRASKALTTPGKQSKYANSRMTVAQHVRNSLEKVVFAEYPQIAACKARLLQHGAAAACMSGSGASVFGLFREASAAQFAVQALSTEAQASCADVSGSVPSVRVWVQPL